MMERNERLALVILVLRREPATNGVLHALSLIEAAMPLSGTPEHRAAFAAAHERRPDLTPDVEPTS